MCYVFSHQNAFVLGLTNITEFSSKIKTDIPYYINVLARGKEDQLEFAYNPIEVFIQGRSISVFFIVTTLLAILVLSGLIYFFYRKYSVAKKRLDYEMEEVRAGGVAVHVNSDENPNEISKEKEPNQYKNLAEDISISKI